MDYLVIFTKYSVPTYCILCFFIVYQFGFDFNWRIFEIARTYYFIIGFVALTYYYIKRKKRDESTLYIATGSFLLLLSALLTLFLSQNFNVLNYFGYQQHFFGPWDIPLIPIQIGILIEVLFFSLGLSVKNQLTLKNKNKLLVENEGLQKEANQKLALKLQLEKEEKEKVAIQEALIKAELKTLRNQLKPHFIYNCFAAILNFMEKMENEQAINYLKQFSELLGYVLDLSEQSSISLQKELEVIKNYVSLEQMRFPNKFTFDIKNTGAINLEAIMLPPLISQPFVENAIKHGLLPKEENRLLELGILHKNNAIQFYIEDNGMGRDKFLMKKKVTRGGRGIKISQERLVLFNKENNTHITVEIVDKVNKLGEPCGTLVLFNIPLENQIINTPK